MSPTRNATAAALVAALCMLGGCGIGNAQTRLRTAVDAQQPTLDDCYADALQRDRTLSGVMQLVLHVDEGSGRITKVDITDPGLQDVQLQECVKTVLTGVALDPPPKANLEVEYTLQFSASS
jgi:hypothetical protein